MLAFIGVDTEQCILKLSLSIKCFKNYHFLFKLNPLSVRFAALQEPLEKKKKKVDEKENLREFNKLAGDEEQYLKEKQIALDNNNLGLLHIIVRLYQCSDLSSSRWEYSSFSNRIIIRYSGFGENMFSEPFLPMIHELFL